MMSLRQKEGVVEVIKWVREQLASREDLLTPPEFRGLDLAEHHPAARIGGARIELVQASAGTCLGTCYQQIPVRLMPPFQFDGEPASLLYLINLTAGLMDGDGHLIEITARKDTHTVVTGQSATRVHPALASYATQQWTVGVEDNACLVILPGPVIPFRGCRYYQRARVELAAQARLIWGDIWLAGRYDRGELSEHYQFERIVQDSRSIAPTGLSIANASNGMAPGPPKTRVRIGGERPPVPAFSLPDPCRKSSRSPAPTCNGRYFGSTRAIAACMVRAPGRSDCRPRESRLRVAGYWTAGPDASPWLLESSSLAPNHWFLAPGGTP